jgi:glyceraldehyde 3-phosphate dehydrogenase
MTVRIGINGFGRMGRLALRAGWGAKNIEFVHVNELSGGAETAAHLLMFDSIHGRWPYEVRALERGLEIDGKKLSFSAHAAPGAVPWADAGVDIVLECSGKFRTPATLAPYFESGVRKVIVAAPVKDKAALNVVLGVNDHEYQPEKHHLLTAASCTTNCLAPVVKVIHEGIGIRHGAITTIHDITNTQTVVDAPHKDLRRARASSLSLIPTTTGSATAIGLIYPELNGKLNGMAVRVPLLNASLTDCVFEVTRATTVEEVNALLKQAADGPLRGILGYETRPLVSVDFKDDPHSAIVDALSTMVIDGTSVKVLAWYDNEIGYVHRMIELAQKVGAGLR